jgi:hypothetical protein
MNLVPGRFVLAHENVAVLSAEFRGMLVQRDGYTLSWVVVAAAIDFEVELAVGSEFAGHKEHVRTAAVVVADDIDLVDFLSVQTTVGYDEQQKRLGLDMVAVGSYAAVVGTDLTLVVVV